MKVRTTLVAGALLLAFTATAAEKYPKLGPLPPPPIPKDNPNTPEKVALGKKLFWDNRLSGDNSMPCVSCHLPTLGWGDGGQISRGYPGTKHWRNSQTVLNSAYYSKGFWEGSVTSLEQQAPAAAGGGVAGNGDDSVMEMRLRFLPEYVAEFKRVFGTEWPRINDAWRAIAAYERTVVTEVAFLSGVDPYETKTTLFTQWMMPGNSKLIFVTPHKTMGVAWAEANDRGMWLPINIGTDTVLHMAMARIIIENNWQDQEFIDQWIAKPWEVDSGYGRGTRNTGWQWRTTWGTWQSDWEDYKKFILSQEESKLDVAAQITGIPAEKIRLAAEWLAKPVNGKRPKASFMCEKGNYWSNNYMNTASFAALGLICGSGNRPGQVISRGGGHQRGWMGAGGGSGWLNPEKYPGRRKKSFNLDRWLMNGEIKFAWVFGTTWVAAMMASDALREKMASLTNGNAHQITSLDRAAIFETLKQRVDSGGMVMVDSDIYPCEPVGTDFADFVLPAATWGEDDLTRCNSERRLRLYAKFYDAPGEAKPDWWAVMKFAEKMGYTADGSYNWKTSNDVFEEAARFGRGGVLNYEPLVRVAKQKGVKGHELLRSMGTTGIQTPVRIRDGKLVGTKRLHDPSNNWGEMESSEVQRHFLYAFNTFTGKAYLLKSPWKFAGWSQYFDAVKPRTEKGEIWVTNGRINETWQSAYDDRRKPHLHQRWPDNFIIIHPNDAKKRGIESGDWVEIVNDAVYVQTGQPQGVLDADLTFNQLMKDGHIKTTVGKFKAVAIVSDEIKEGVSKSNFNTPKSMANAVVSAVPDPMTNNYRYKLGRGTLTKVGESEYKTDLTRMSLKPRPIV